jgi:hypothetical protein
MNKTDNTKQAWHGILLLKCLHLPKPAQQRLKYKAKDISIKTSKQLLYTPCFTVEQPLIHETAGLFPVKLGEKKLLYFCKLFNEISKQTIAVKQQNTSLQNEKQLLRTEFVLAHAHNVENRP